MTHSVTKYNLNISFPLLRMPFKNLLLCFFWIHIILWSPGKQAFGEISDANSWKNIQTRYTIILYQTLKDLERFNGNIDYSPGGWGLKNLFSGFRSNDPAVFIQKKVDSVFEKAQKILGMHKSMDKIIIKIYPDTNRFHELQHKTAEGKGAFRAWYTYEKNTIYLNNDDVHEGILAHEIAHAIIDHFLTVRPPIATSEILSRYVDQHLYD